MKVGVTGGAGFIGGHVVDELVARGHTPLVFDPLGRGWYTSDGERKAEGMLGSVNDYAAVSEMAARVDAVIHLAAVLGTQETIDDPEPAAETNVLGGLKVLRACRKYKLPLVNICVGNWWMRNTYSLSKNTIEGYLEMFRDEHGLRAVNVRCMNAYGPRQSVAPPFGAAKVRKITPSFVCRALSGMMVQVYGTGAQISDMVYVGDVASTLVAALETVTNRNVPEHGIEIGPVEPTSVLDVARMVIGIADAKYVSDDRSIDERIEFLPMRPGEKDTADLTAEKATYVENILTDLGVDPFTARKLLRPLTNEVSADYRTLAGVGVNYRDLTPLAVGLTRTIDYFAEGMNSSWYVPETAGLAAS